MIFRSLAALLTIFLSVESPGVSIAHATGAYQRTRLARAEKNAAAEIMAAHGAVGDWDGASGTDNSSALQEAIDNNCSVSLPPGRFRSTRGIASTCTSVSIRGAGPGVSELVFDGPVGVGISIDASSVDTDRAQISISDLSIKTTQDHAGAAVAIRQAPLINSHRFSRHVVIHNVIVSGDDTYRHGWQDGFIFTDVQQVSISNSQLTGKIPIPITEKNSTQSRHAIWIRETGKWVPDVYSIVNSQIYGWQNGVFGDGVAEGSLTIEGVALSNTNIVAVMNGVNLTVRPAGHPLLQIANSHINAYKSDIKTDGVTSITLSNNLFYIPPNSSQSEPKLLDISNGSYCNLTNNQFWAFPSVAKGTPGTAINIGPNFKHCTIDRSNTINSVSTSLKHGAYISGDNGTLGHDISPRVFGALTGGNDAAIFDAHKDGNAVSYGREELAASKAGALLVESENRVDVPYDTIKGGKRSFNFARGAVIPPGSAIRRVRACVGGVWEPNAVGVRRISITKNATDNFLGVGDMMVVATGLKQPMTVCSGTIAVTGGDVIGSTVFQNSGAPLNFSGAWFTIESLN